MSDWTIDELARRAGTTSRNIRAYQERGLVPPPRLVGRVGYYSEGHLARLRHIAHLLERGFSLASIRELFDAWERGYGLADVLGFEEALAAPWDHEPGTSLLSADELIEAFGGNDRTLARATRMGILEVEGDRFRVPSPRLLEAGRELVAAGVPLDVLLDEAEALTADLDTVARRWVALFRDHVWSAYVARGMPAEELQQMTDFLRRIRPLLGSIVAPLLAQAMERQVAAVTAETLGAPPPPAPRSQPEAS